MRKLYTSGQKFLESNMMKAREYLDNLNKNDLNKDKQKKLIN